MTVMFIQGVAFNGFRSFGSEGHRLSPFGKVNLFIGRNNSGKSNILLWLHQHHAEFIKSLKEGLSYHYSGTEENISAEKYPVYVELALSVSSESIEALIRKLPKQHIEGALNRRDTIDKLLRSKYFSTDGQTAWFKYVKEPSGRFLLETPQQLEENGHFSHYQWEDLWHILTRQSGGNLFDTWIPQISHILSPAKISYPATHLIPAIRKIGEPNSGDSDLSGKGIIDQLAKLQNPILTELPKKSLFKKSMGSFKKS